MHSRLNAWFTISVLLPDVQHPVPGLVREQQNCCKYQHPSLLQSMHATVLHEQQKHALKPSGSKGHGSAPGALILK